MAVLVDPAVWPHRGRRWAHLVSDLSLLELHTFATGLGLPRRAFQGDHYDVCEQLRQAALEAGATPVSAGELVRRLRRAGLRSRPRVRRLPGEAVAFTPLVSGRSAGATPWDDSV